MDTAGGASTHAVEVFGTLRLDHAEYVAATNDFERNASTETAYLPGLGRVLYDATLPSASGSGLHVLLNFGNHLGSSTAIVDKDSGALVEYTTYLPYGATESDYRPEAWHSHREDYRFTGKEEDVEVGLTYFGARYYSPYMGRFVSPDPLTVHALGADLNPYAYVSGRVFNATDPNGLTPRPPPPQNNKSNGASGQSGCLGQEDCSGGGGAQGGGSVNVGDLLKVIGDFFSGGGGSSGPGNGGGLSDPPPPPPPPPSAGWYAGGVLNPASGIHWPRVAGASLPDEAYDQDIPLGTGADFARSAWNAGIHNFPPIGPGAWATKWALEKFAIADEPADSFASAAGVITYFGVTAVAGGAIEAVEAGGAAGLRGLLGAARGAPRAYSVAFETTLSEESLVASRGSHFAEANEALYNAMQSSPEVAGSMRQLGIEVAPGARGAFPRTPPPGWTWHHELEPGVMRLVPRAQHTLGSPWWYVLHPGGQGGYSIWGQ